MAVYIIVEAVAYQKDDMTDNEPQAYDFRAAIKEC